MRSLLVLLLVPLIAAADTVVLKGGKRFSGRVIAEDPEVVVNIYNSTHKEMVLGVHRFPRAKVKKIIRTLPAPHHEFQRRLAAAYRLLREVEATRRQAEDLRREVEGADVAFADEEMAEKREEVARLCLDLARWCEERKLKEERLFALELAAREEGGGATARQLLGSKAPRGSWPEQRAWARKYVEADDDAARAEALAAIRRDKDFPFKERYLQRARRSARQPTGYVKDRPVALRADKLMDNARYTLVVPRSYDPLVPTPLVIGLHGGGTGGADGKLVVGSGWQAMNFYRGHCEQRGWICACPTALVGGWRAKANSELVDALLEELCALYNIDENRVYLVGHSMGGGGTWSQGARLPETWAAIAPAASFGVHGIERFSKTRTGFYVYHSDNDPRCSVEGVRPRMRNLPGSGADFVYTELPGRGHSFPGPVVRDIFGFFEMRTLARRAGKYKPQVRPRSSFLRKWSRDEKKYLAPLQEEASAGEESLRALLKDLRTGGGVAEQAVPRLVEHPNPKVSASVASILLKGTSGADVRRYAARVLGGRKAADQLKALGRVLLVETEANALLEVLAAIGEINDPRAGDALLRFLKKRAEYLEKRTQGDVLSHSDWQTILPTMARACTLVGTYRPKKGAAVLATAVCDRVLLSKTGVRYDVQNQRPLPYVRALAEAACGALARLGGDDGRAALEKMAKAGAGATGASSQRVYGPVAVLRDWAKDPTVAGHVREALANLQD
ncbi:MAG: hypothetical protein ACYTEZ_06880 [Planctomycetota bacterium]